MFGFFRTRPFQDPEVGVLRRSGGYWRGTLSLPRHEAIELRVAGSRKRPDPDLLLLARALPQRTRSLLRDTEASLFEHYGILREATEPRPSEDPMPIIPSAESIWPHVHPVHVLIDLLGGIPTVEFAYRMDWEDEHTVGARFQDWAFIELCGSV